MSIGEVLGLLRPEFPDITISKLRFLEAEGLVEPLRAPSGYRKYTPADLDRLRFVLTAQRDRYLPLRVIREQLDALDRGERVVGFLAPSPSAAPLPAPSAPSPGPHAPHPPPPLRPSPVPQSPVSQSPVPQSPVSHAPVPPRSLDPPYPGPPVAVPQPSRGEVGDVRLTRAQLAERAGLDEAGLADLEQYGLLTPAPNGYYTGEALTVARTAAQLSGYGLEARHLRPYRATADREVGLLAQLVPPLARQAGPGGRAQALETVHELAALCAQLHGALVRQGLRQVLGA